MDVRIVTPDGEVFFSSSVTELTAPGFDGEFGVLEGHTPFLTTFEAGKVSLKDAAGDHAFAVWSGFIEVSPESVSIAVENAEPAGAIDIDRARKDAAKLEAQTTGKSYYDEDYAQLELKLLRALNRVRIGGGEA
jgi:F-type H+-transporting ATPase subunit epsilon